MKPEPQLARLVDAPPVGPEWAHEVKYDGYRIFAEVNSGKARLYSRNGLDWTAKFASLAAAFAKLRIKQCLIDGEAVWIADDGRTSFGGLQRAISEARESEIRYFAFDLLECDGEDLRERALADRKARLKKIIGANKRGSPLMYSEHWTEPGGRGALKAACSHHLEGIVSKRLEDPYRAGRGDSWLKSKCKGGQEFVIGGYTPPKASRAGLGALLIGVRRDDGRLTYAGKVGTGFDHATLRTLGARLEKMRASRSPFAGDVAERGAFWVKPELVANVEFAEMTESGRVRHASFQGLREDKRAEEVRIEKPASLKTKKKPSAKSKAAGKAPAGAPKLTHPDRVIFKGLGATKQDLFEWYRFVGKRMFAFLEKRPLSVLRCPDGAGKSCFFQKHWEPALGGLAVQNAESKAREESQNIFYLTDPSGLLELAQMGVIEIHAWGSRLDDVDRPDQLIFDLDPGPGVSWKETKAAAEEVREFLSALGLETFVKISGGKGLHVQAPIEPKYDWEQAKAFCKGVAQTLETREPKRYVSTMTKSLRRGRIFLDYLRNGFGATAVAPYSVRARDGAPIALPIAWSELDAIDSPTPLALPDAISYLRARKRDPWAGYEKARSTIAALEAPKKARRSK